MLSRRYAIRFLVLAALATMFSSAYGQIESGTGDAGPAAATAKPSLGSKFKNSLGKLVGHERVERMSQKVTGTGKTQADRLNSDKKMMAAHVKDAVKKSK